MNNKRILFLVTGTTQGLGKEIINIFNKYDCISINRKKFNENDILIDLSLNNFSINISKEIEKYEKIFFIANASTIKPINKIKELTDDDLDISIHTNFINQVKIILQIVKSNKKYSILNITTGAAYTSNTELSLYSSSKAAMHRFIEILKKEEENNPNAIYIDNFDPGRMQTKMQKDLIYEKKLNIDIENFSLVEEVAEKIYEVLGEYINE